MYKKYIAIFIAVGLISNNYADVVTDGTLGVAEKLRGHDFIIGDKWGQQVGTYLFHSFDTFSLDSNQSATFTGPEAITHVISRVTGGKASLIDGLLRSEIPGSDLYFLNPAGILLGPNAEIDIPGSLYLSTADYLKLGKTGVFNAAVPENTLLTVAPPSAFGFLDDSSAEITAQGSQLFLPNLETESRILFGEAVPTSTLALIGGDISLKDNVLFTFGSDAYLVSVASVGEVPIEPAALTEKTFPTWGTLQITNTAVPEIYGNIDASGRGGGHVYIRAGQFILDKGFVFSDTWGDQPGQGISIYVSDTLTLRNAARITTQALSLGVFEATGKAGNISIEAKAVHLIEGGQIDSSTETTGAAGQLSLAVKDTLSLTNTDDDSARSGLFSSTFDSGRGGDITIVADTLAMNNGAVISAKTRGSGDGQAGDLSIRVGALDLESGAQIDVSAGSLHEGHAGQGMAGKLIIVADKQVVIQGSLSGLVSSVWNQGRGGAIAVTAPVITLEKGALIEAATATDAPAGRIVLKTNHLKLAEGSLIATATVHGQGRAGDIKILAREGVLIKDAKIRVDTEGKGQGGNAYIKTPHLQLIEGGTLTAGSSEQGRAGQLVLMLGNTLYMQEGAIETATESADGGNISITIPGYLYLIDSRITTSVKTSTGNGGNMTLKPDFIVLDNSQIIAKAFKGHGGNIHITTTNIYNFSGEPTNEVISASSAFGVDGIVEVASPEKDVFKDVIILTSSFIDAGRILEKSCRAITFTDFERISRFAVVPYKGRAQSPEDWSSSHLLVSDKY